MATIADLLTSSEGALLCAHRVTALDGLPRQWCALTFDARGVCIVEPDLVLQLRRLVTLEGNGYTVEPVNIDAVRYQLTPSQIADGLRVGARWAVLLVGEDEARARRADLDRDRTEQPSLERPKRDTMAKGSGLGRELVHFAESATAHKARVEATDINALIFELRCRGVFNPSLHGAPKARIVELVLQAHGFPHAFPRYWQPLLGATKGNRVSLETVPLPYDPNDLIVAPSAELPDHSVTT